MAMHVKDIIIRAIMNIILLLYCYYCYIILLLLFAHPRHYPPTWMWGLVSIYS
jgi:hypothetical protein